jgi:hypothetical protein
MDSQGKTCLHICTVLPCDASTMSPSTALYDGGVPVKSIEKLPREDLGVSSCIGLRGIWDFRYSRAMYARSCRGASSVFRVFDFPERPLDVKRWDGACPIDWDERKPKPRVDRDGCSEDG